MAEIYKRVRGKKLEKVIALHRDVQDSLDREAFTAGIRAEGLLAEHRFEGDAFIEIEEGDIDRYVVLNDERGFGAAMTIEYGRSPDENGRGEMEGLFILHRATGMRGD